MSYLWSSLDLHILMNTVHSPSIVNSAASASWLPLCLAKYNPSGFVHAFITFLQSEACSESGASAPEHKAKSRISSSGDPLSETLAQGDSFKAELSNRDVISVPDVGLICVTANGDFESIRAWCSVVTGVSCSGVHQMSPHRPAGSAP
jgi:vacuolar fusion protein MON1